MSPHHGVSLLEWDGGDTLVEESRIFASRFPGQCDRGAGEDADAPPLHRSFCPTPN